MNLRVHVFLPTCMDLALMRIAGIENEMTDLSREIYTGTVSSQLDHRGPQDGGQCGKRPFNLSNASEWGASLGVYLIRTE